MEPEKKVEMIVNIVSSFLTFLTVIIGIWQFNKGQKELKEREIEQRNFELAKMNNQASIETLSKFKELQNKLYIEATSVISFLIVNENFDSEQYQDKLERFWQLYWVELSAIESEDVESVMKDFGDILKKIESTNFKEYHQELKNAGYNVAQVIKKSASTWELPEGLKNKTTANRT